MISKRPAQQPHLGGPAEFSFNIVAGSRRGKTTTALALLGSGNGQGAQPLGIETLRLGACGPDRVQRRGSCRNHRR